MAKKQKTVEQNILDRAIAYVAPEWGAKRARARALTDLMVRQFDAGKSSRYSSDWIAAGGAAPTETMGYLATMRYRARDLYRNNSHAARAVEVWTTYIVGTGIIPQARTKSAPRNKKMMQAWKLWAESTACDANGRLDFYGIQSLAIRTMARDGEVLLRKIPATSKQAVDGAPPFQLQVLEADYIDETKTETRGPVRIIQGVEYDKFDRIVAYWLYKNHPGDPLAAAATSVRVDASEIVHLFITKRPGQVRGYSMLAPVVMRIREKQEYDEAMLVRRKVEACFTAWVTRNDDTGAQTVGPARVEDGDRFESLEPGMINYLRPNEQVLFHDITGTGGYGEYNKATLQEIAVGTGIPYYELSGDTQGAGTYSSIRAGTISFRRSIEQIQWHVVIPQLCDRVWIWFCDEGVKWNLWPEGDRDVSWMPPRFEMIDPMKDIGAEVLAIRNGLTTLPDAIMRQGYDPDVKMVEAAEFFAKTDALGLVFDCDPRQTTKSGQIQTPQETSSDMTQEEDAQNG